MLPKKQQKIYEKLRQLKDGFKRVNEPCVFPYVGGCLSIYVKAPSGYRNYNKSNKTTEVPITADAEPNNQPAEPEV